jgi:hypothetical protein
VAARRWRRPVALQHGHVGSTQLLLALAVGVVPEQRLAPPAMHGHYSLAHVVPTSEQRTLHHRDRLAA